MAGSDKNPWSTGLCDCFSDMNSCCLTCWCPCVSFGRIVNIVDKGEHSCLLAGTLFVLLHYVRLNAICNFVYRSRMRSEYKLSGHDCGDLCTSIFCLECAICQQYRELQNRGFDMSADWAKNMRRNPQGIVMAPVVEDGMKR